MKNRVLILTEYIGENYNSTAYYWSQIVKYLKNNNYDVLLITPENEHSIEFTLKYNVNVKFVKLTKYNKNSLLSRLIGQIMQTFRFMMTVKNECALTDLLFSGTNPIITMVSLTILKIRYKFKWLVLVHDVFPNNLVAAGIISEKNFVYRLLSFVSTKMYSSANEMICIGRDMQVLLQTKTGKQHCIHYIPNWSSTEKIFPLAKSENNIIIDLCWQSEVVYQFFGNMGRLQGIDNLLDAISKTSNSNARYLFIGCGSESSRVQTAIDRINKECGYIKAYFYGRLDLEKNQVGLNACDVSLVTLSSNMLGLGVPSKAYFSMAADKPILYVGDINSELAQLVSEHPIGWFCEPEQPMLLAELIDNITKEFSNNNVSLKQPRAVLIANFSEEMALDKIERVVRSTII